MQAGTAAVKFAGKGKKSRQHRLRGPERKAGLWEMGANKVRFRIKRLLALPDRPATALMGWKALQKKAW